MSAYSFRIGIAPQWLTLVIKALDVRSLGFVSPLPQTFVLLFLFLAFSRALQIMCCFMHQCAFCYQLNTSGLMESRYGRVQEGIISNLFVATFPYFCTFFCYFVFIFVYCLISLLLGYLETKKIFKKYFILIFPNKIQNTKIFYFYFLY